jgi:Rieske Fe-S protein
MKSTRLFGCLGLFIALAGLVSLLTWVVVRFSTPQPSLVQVGQVQDFPPGQAPRLIDQDGTLFYVLNVNGDLVALYARSLRHTRCLVKWDETRGVFVDPCLGTRFTPTGEYQGGGPPQELVQLPLQVKDGQLWVEINFPKR